MTGRSFRDRLALARATVRKASASDGPSPSGGAGGVSGETPPLTFLEMLSDTELDRYVEEADAVRMRLFEAGVAAIRKPKVRRMFRDYTIKNCEEAIGDCP